jgi:hypothetical protein
MIGESNISLRSALKIEIFCIALMFHKKIKIKLSFKYIKNQNYY